MHCSFEIKGKGNNRNPAAVRAPALCRPTPGPLMDELGFMSTAGTVNSASISNYLFSFAASTSSVPKPFHDYKYIFSVSNAGDTVN